ncbi:TetR/AcrR family transcriptional regulator [Altererythrobacter sp.]|uniref:TetR/AcrR family transcriptional regulator n=1 Tax=Altererythrobacter sp. TaxID=1872480 RepID=UPI003D071287
MKLAERIVLSEGLKALTLRRLAKEIGISETQVNNSMGSRTDLLCSMARREIAAIETRRQKRVSRSSDHRLRVALSTIGYLHEAAARGPLLKILLRVPEVKSALREERIEAATSARAPILRKLTSGGGMDWQTAKASTAALTAVSLKAGGIVAARRAPFPMVEQICLTIIMAGVASDDELASRNQS